jgi:hypothetical protein
MSLSPSSGGARSCHACGAALGRARAARIRVAPPFEECPRCRALIESPGAREWSVLPPVQRLGWLGSRLAPWATVLALPALAYGALGFHGQPGELRTLLGLSACAALLFLALPVPATLRIIRRSRIRMADPMYCARLVEFERRGVAAGSSTPTT